jgi:hypothetical protein
MMTRFVLRRLWVAVIGFLSFLAAAAEPLIFDSCLDVQGGTVTAVADREQAMLVRSDSRQGQPAIRYNPDVLPGLGSAARLFFYAHQCARLGLPAGTAESAAEIARQADCLGLGALLGGKLLQREDVPALQAALTFSDAEWAVLPGPPRSFDLASCRVSGGGVLQLPLARQPSARQTAWNNCIHACGDRLWNCQKRCGHADCASCLSAFSLCKSGCGADPAARIQP